jgi:hypothetical protein
MEVMIDGVAYVPAPPQPASDSGLLGALEVRFDSDAGSNLTVREYLYKLLSAVWEEQEGFSGKRPFGNSGWEYELYRPLVGAGFIAGEVDEWGDIAECNLTEASEYVAELIRAVFYPPHGP